MPPDIAPMRGDRGIPRSLDGRSAEPKRDGSRARVLTDDGQVRLHTRSGRDITSSVRSIDRLADRQVVLDGELVAEAGTMNDFYRVGPSPGGAESTVAESSARMRSAYVPDAPGGARASKWLYLRALGPGR